MDKATNGTVKGIRSDMPVPNRSLTELSEMPETPKLKLPQEKLSTATRKAFLRDANVTKNQKPRST
jgi:hypothetical protein